jgi:hypothetical protein
MQLHMKMLLLYQQNIAGKNHYYNSPPSALSPTVALNDKS